MDRGQFDGWFGMIELQTMSESERGLGRILLNHFHAIAWSDNADFDPDRAESDMRASKRLICATGARTATVTSHLATHGVNLAAYVMKAPSVAKHRVPDRNLPSGFRLEPATIAPVSAVRLLEIRSLVYFDELMLSGGNGKFLRPALKRLMIDSVKVAGGLEDHEQVARLWQRTRAQASREVNYALVSIDRSPRQLPNPSPITLSSPRLEAHRADLLARYQEWLEMVSALHGAALPHQACDCPSCRAALLRETA